MRVISFDIAYKVMESLAQGKANFYWEGELYYPVVEVFANGSTKYLELKRANLELALLSLDINVDTVEIGVEILEEETDYYRIFGTLSKDITDIEFIKIVDFLSNYGSAEYEEQIKNQF